MAYERVNWENLPSKNTPVNDTNMNKIEQGIYDNSLVVDAIADKLNPTDTETYETAELTEGQITDVIGVSDILIKGQTSQDGEPTPSSPVDVNVVSGSNVINTSNGNLLIPSVIVDNTAILTNNCQVSLIKDEYIITATGNDMYFGRARGAGVVYSNEYGQKIYVNNNINTKISFYITNTNLNNVYITAYNSEGVSLGFTGFASNRGTYTLPEDCDFITFRMGKDRPIVGTDYKAKVMIVYGDVIPTTYEPHQGKELPLDLGTIELCKIGNYQDYFYKSGSRWYLVKNFNKYIEESNNSWAVTGTASGSEVNTKRWQINKIIADSFVVDGGSMNANMCCNYFNRNLLGQMYSLDEVGYNLESKMFSIRLPVEIATTTTEVAQYFSQQEKPLTFYYQIAPTTIEITGTLKEQLEAIYNAPLYEQTNITQTNNDLPMVLDITACKDNINGIKAFIRK